MADSPLVTWFLDQVQKHHWENYLLTLGIGVGVGYVIGWRVTLRKANAEIAKLKIENRKASGDNVEKLSQLRQKSLSQKQLLDIAMGNMRDTILAFKQKTKTVNDMRICRDEMCTIYETQYLDAVGTYVELIPVLIDRKDGRIRAQTELIPALDTMCRFLDMANLEALLIEIPAASPFKLRRASRDGLFARVKCLVPWWCVRTKFQIRKLCKRTNCHVRDE